MISSDDLVEKLIICFVHFGDSAALNDEDQQRKSRRVLLDEFYKPFCGRRTRYRSLRTFTESNAVHEEIIIEDPRILNARYGKS